MTFKAYAHPDTFAEFLSGKENIFFVYLSKTDNYLDKASDYTVEVIIDTDQYDFVDQSNYKANLPIKVSKKQTPEEIFRELELINKRVHDRKNNKPIFPPNQLIDSNKIII